MIKSMKIEPQAAPIRKQTLAKLRLAIIEGRFKPDERLYEKTLCELMGVSRTSVRESLRQLETEGLVKIIPSKGPVVAKLTLEDAVDIYQVREQLEGLAASLFAQKHNADMLKSLEKSLQKFDDYLRKQSDQNKCDGQVFVKISNEFYEIFLKGCGNKVVYKMLDSIHARLTLLRSTSLSQPGRAHQCFNELQEIVSAFRKRDSKAAYEKSMVHIQNASAVALRRIRAEFDKEK